ncbi:MAG: hypothetical protein JJU03_04370 [Idiomarina sp.]|nr:hypothetical protein [Idiomarina sp.]
MADTAAYWMLADTEVPLSWEPSQLERFETFLKHALLFNQKLMISDTQAVNCVNLRRLMQKGSGFHELLHRDIFEIAIRGKDNTNEQISLIDLRDQFAARGVNRFQSDDFLRNDDLTTLQSSSSTRVYHVETLGTLYTEAVQALITRNDIQTALSPAHFELFNALLTQEVAQQGRLTREFMQNTLGARLKSIHASDVWAQHRDLIMRISDAPYVTAIPQVMTASPIYSPQHQASFDFVYGVSSAQVEPLLNEDNQPQSYEISTGLNLSGYELGLRQLNADDIFDLRNSVSFKEYILASQSSVSSAAQLDGIYEKLAAYQEAIDKRIVERYAGLKVSRVDKSANRWRLNASRRLCADTGELMFGLAVDVLAAPIAFGSFFVNEVREYKRDKQKRLLDKHRQQLAGLASRAGSNGKIEVERHTRPTLDTVYKSV